MPTQPLPESGACGQSSPLSEEWTSPHDQEDLFATTGVDLVLNSLAEEKLQASVRCLAQHGRFLEIGKFDLSNNHPLG